MWSSPACPIARVEEVVLGPEGVREGSRPGMTYVDNSTIKPETARRQGRELE